MTPFSDADLAKLKAELVNDPDEHLYPELHGLVVRLEAAEACIPHVYANRERFQALEKWKRSKGI